MEARIYDIIYKLTEEMEAALRGMLEPEEVEVVEGRAEVRQVFRVGKSTAIAGSYVTDGRIVRGGARVYRGGKLIAMRGSAPTAAATRLASMRSSGTPVPGKPAVKARTGFSFRRATQASSAEEKSSRANAAIACLRSTERCSGITSTIR